MKKHVLALFALSVFWASCSKEEHLKKASVPEFQEQKSPSESANAILDFYEESIGSDKLVALDVEIPKDQISFHVDLLVNIFSGKHQTRNFGKTHKSIVSVPLTEALETGLQVYEFASKASYVLDSKIAALPKGVEVMFIQSEIEAEHVNFVIHHGVEKVELKNDAPERLLDLRCKSFSDNGSGQLVPGLVDQQENYGCHASEKHPNAFGVVGEEMLIEEIVDYISPNVVVYCNDEYIQLVYKHFEISFFNTSDPIGYGNSQYQNPKIPITEADFIGDYCFKHQERLDAMEYIKVRMTAEGVTPVNPENEIEISASVGWDRIPDPDSPASGWHNPAAMRIAVDYTVFLCDRLGLTRI